MVLIQLWLTELQKIECENQFKLCADIIEGDTADFRHFRKAVAHGIFMDMQVLCGLLDVEVTLRIRLHGWE